MYIKRLKALFRIVRVRYYLWEYNVFAVLKYIARVFSGSVPYARLAKYPGAVFQASPLCDSKRVALFVAFHSSDFLPISNKLYLDALQQCKFRIVYIHNGPLVDDVKEGLSKYCERIYCRENIGQDMGAWKDAYLCLQRTGYFDALEWLLMCNDSNFYVGGQCSHNFVNLLSDELDKGDADVIALNKNYELCQHFQSFFLCYRRSVFTKKSFFSFWLNYKPIDSRFHAITYGELKITREVLQSSRARILYNSSDLVDNIAKLSKQIDLFYSLLPQNALYLAPSNIDSSSVITMLGLQRILALLDHHNPSHAYALLFVYFLKSPFIKKDIFRQGTFSFSQISLCLQLIGIPEYLPALHKEIVRAVQAGGSNISYMRYLKVATRKGINTQVGLYSGHGEALASLGLNNST
jgi:hypothetical protein